MPIRIARASVASVFFTTPQEIVVNQLDDSIRSYLYDKDGNGITSTANNSKRAIDSYLRVEFATGSNTRPAVNNVSSTILVANTGRRFASITNNSGSTVYIKFGSAAVISQGIPIVSQQTYEINLLNMWIGTIQAIKSGASSINLDVFEGSL